MLIDLPSMFEGFYQIQSYKADYKVICRKTVGPGWIQVECAPKKKSANFLRFSLQPSLTGPEGVAIMKKLADLMYYGGYSDFLTKARVTRIDVAADCLNVQMDDLGFLPSKLCTCGVFLSAKHGVRSLYIGSRKSESHFNIYDKGLQQKAVYGVDIAVPTLRIERRYKGHRPLHAIADMSNPFSSLHVTSSKLEISGMDKDLVAMVNLAAKAASLQVAVSRLSRPRRSIVAMAAKAQQVDWWNSADLWAQWPLLLQTLGLTTGVTAGKPKLCQHGADMV